MIRINKKAVILGWLVGVIGSVFAGLLFGIISIVIIHVSLIKSDIGLDQGFERAAEYFATSIGSLILSLYGALFFVILGGYVAARIAKFSELKHAMLVGLLYLLVDIVVHLVTVEPFPLWFTLTSWSLAIPAALFGGFLRLRTKNGSQTGVTNT